MAHDIYIFLCFPLMAKISSIAYFLSTVSNGEVFLFAEPIHVFSTIFKGTRGLIFADRLVRESPRRQRAVHLESTAGGPNAGLQKPRGQRAGSPEAKRLCGSGVMGQSALLRGELGKGGRPAGRGLGWRKLLLSEKSDWDSAAAPSKGERAAMSATLTGTTRPGLDRPGGGDGESLHAIWDGRRGRWEEVQESKGVLFVTHSYRMFFLCLKK